MNEENWENHRVLITGGLGFIGSNLANILVDLGAHVTVLDNLLAPYGGNISNVRGIKDKIKIIKGDLRDWSLVQETVKNKDLIFHLAAQVDQHTAMENPRLDLDINCSGTLNILEGCRLHNEKAKIVFTSSRVVIGEPLYFPVDEEHPTNPKNIYGINKLFAEKYCLLYNDIYDLRTTILRLSNVYGPKAQIRHPHYGVLNLFIGYVLTNRDIPIYGDGTQTRDYVFVEDVVKAIILAAQNEKSIGGIFFVGSGIETMLLDIAKTIINVVGKGNYKFVPFPPKLKRTDIKRFVTNYSKIKKLLGWNPETKLHQGITNTVNFYMKNLEDYYP
jgi:nucleoside-diphosphate-sugar epimerase